MLIIDIKENENIDKALKRFKNRRIKRAQKKTSLRKTISGEKRDCEKSCLCKPKIWSTKRSIKKADINHLLYRAKLKILPYIYLWLIHF